MFCLLTYAPIIICIFRVFAIYPFIAHWMRCNYIFSNICLPPPSWSSFLFFLFCFVYFFHCARCVFYRLVVLLIRPFIYSCYQSFFFFLSRLAFGIYVTTRNNLLLSAVIFASASLILNSLLFNNVCLLMKRPYNGQT